jgi:23S rRNA (adenine2030-N6)-methyltransferase
LSLNAFGLICNDSYFTIDRQTNLIFKNMLSYRHAFHAGNHADVLKHAVLIYCIRHLLKKEKPFLYTDTHAGAGLYELDKGYAESKKEYLTGISRVQKESDLPPILKDYVDVVSDFNSAGITTVYPGSPLIAKSLLRPNDQLRLHELHTNDFEILRSHTTDDPRITILKKNGLSGMIKAFPPPSRRGLVLIDPSYEVKADYDMLPFAIDDALHKFAEAMILVWYPMLENGSYRMLTQNLQRLSADRWLKVELNIREPGEGLYGSGMWVINPPWELPKAIESMHQLLPSILGEDSQASLSLDYSIP